LRDFWRRWHVSLSEWLRDNVYVPLGGNRHGVARTAANLLLTMLLGGLWHGAAWHFVAWGAWHGAGLAALRRVGSAGGAAGRPRSGGLVAGIGRAATLLFVLGGWVLFRATDLGVAGRMLAALATPTAPEWFREAAVNLAWFGLPMLALDLAQRRAGCPEWGARLGFVGRTLVQGPMLFAVAAYWRREGSPFIYFQF
jgi:alginate O-acetyltransferase complex protein AlgI